MAFFLPLSGKWTFPHWFLSRSKISLETPWSSHFSRERAQGLFKRGLWPLHCHLMFLPSCRSPIVKLLHHVCQGFSRPSAYRAILGEVMAVSFVQTICQHGNVGQTAALSHWPALESGSPLWLSMGVGGKDPVLTSNPAGWIMSPREQGSSRKYKNSNYF